jgi:hypothetical protein
MYYAVGHRSQRPRIPGGRGGALGVAQVGQQCITILEAEPRGRCARQPSEDGQAFERPDAARAN